MSPAPSSGWWPRLLFGSALLFSLTAPLSNALLGISTAGLLAAAAWGALRREISVPRPYVWLVLGWLAAIAVSAGLSSEQALSVRALLRKSLPAAGIFLAALYLGSEPRRAHRILVAVMAAGLVISIDALAQTWLGHDPLRGRPLHGLLPSGTFSNPNSLASYLLIVIPLQVWAALQARRLWLRLLWAGAALLAMWVLMLTESRIAWLLLLAVFAGWLMVFRKRSLIGCLLVFGALGMWRSQGMGPWDTLLRLDPGRQEGWGIAWQMFRDHPVFGIGLGTYMRNYMRYPLVEGPWSRPQYAHNCYLQIMAEVGAVGVFAFAALVGSVWASGLRRLWQRSPAPGLLAGALGGVLALMLHFGIDTGFYQVSLVSLFWFLLGLSGGMAWTPQRQGPA